MLFYNWQDPSIQQVAKNTANNQQSLDEYNPFDSPTQSQPATLQANQTLPQYTTSAQQYQVNAVNPINGSSSGGGVTQINTQRMINMLGLRQSR